MTAKKNGWQQNGWKRIALIATTIVALSGVGVVFEPYINLPWAPKVAFVWAAENTLARLDNQLFSYEELLQKARDRGDAKAIRRQTKNVTDTRRKIKDVEAEMKKK